VFSWPRKQPRKQQENKSLWRPTCLRGEPKALSLWLKVAFGEPNLPRETPENLRTPADLCQMRARGLARSTQRQPKGQARTERISSFFAGESWAATIAPARNYGRVVGNRDRHAITGHGTGTAPQSRGSPRPGPAGRGPRVGVCVVFYS